MMKTALVYDRVNKWGGAEKVLLQLNNMFPDAPLYTSVYDPKKAPWADTFPEVVPSFLNKIPYLRDKHEWLAPLMPIAFESFDFSEYNLVISVTSESAKGIITKPGTKHVCYMLTPTRYLWSGYDEYFRGRFSKILSKPAIEYLRGWDKVAVRRPDKILAISKEVQKRIKKYYEIDSDIVYPPVDIEKFVKLNSENERNTKSQISKEDKYFLVVSRLVPYKKVELVVKAFNDLKEKLIIIGTGKQEKYLRKIANGNIEIKGFVEEDELIDYYRNAQGFIFPQNEDFGITAVEAQAAGIPVIAFRAGGVLDTVVENETGIFFNKQKVDSLKKAILRFKKKNFRKESIISNAEKFSKERFKKEFTKAIN